MQLDRSPSNPGCSSLERPLWLPTGTDTDIASHASGREAEFSSSVITPSVFNHFTMDPQGTANSWDMNANQVPGWFVGDDFDLTALNSSIMGPVQDQLPQFPSIGPEPTPPATDDHTDYTPIAVVERKEDVVSRHWLTYLATDRSGLNTPDVPEQTQVDDAHRESLSRQLQQRVQNEPLPSTDFLVIRSAKKRFFANPPEPLHPNVLHQI